MFDLLLIILRIAALAGASIVLLAALTIDATEQRRAQGVLEEWWLRVSGLETVALGRNWALIKVAAEKALLALRRVIGPSIYSDRARAIMSYVGGASLAAATSAWMMATGQGGDAKIGAGGMAVLSAVSLGMAVIAPRITDWALLRTVAVSGMFPFVMWMVAFTGVRELAFPVLMLTLAGSIGAIRLTERVLTDLSMLQEPTLGKVVGAALLALFPAAALLGAWRAAASVLSGEAGTAAILVPVVGASLPVASLIAIFASLIAMLLAHRAMWMVLNRVMYALQLHELPSKRRFLFGLGVAMLGVALPVEELGPIAKLLKSVLQG